MASKIGARFSLVSQPMSLAIFQTASACIHHAAWGPGPSLADGPEAHDQQHGYSRERPWDDLHADQNRGGIESWCGHGEPRIQSRRAINS